jgi:D-glutamate N-acetyltransferase
MPAKSYLVLAEGYSADPHYGKTARGVMRYAKNPVVAVVDSERAGEELDGVPVVASVAEALRFEPTTALVGVAPAGGRLPEKWRALLEGALAAGLNLESGMHQFLGDDPVLARRAAEHGAEIRDLRRVPEGLSVPTGANLEHDATVVLTVGSDCAIGKMSVALELDRAAQERGLRSVFVPTGQTGIAIAGWGISVDAVVADFIAGAAERLVVEGAARGDLLWIEGQGSLVHPDYSGVTVGLYHGSAPHLLVLCHQSGDTHIEDHPRHPIPPLVELVELHERVSLPARRARVAAVALNTRRLDEDAAREAIATAAEETGLPVDDPVRFGPVPLLDSILKRVNSGIRRL